MQGLITLDFGNTHPHAGIFLKKLNSWEFQKSIPLNDLNNELKVLNLNPSNTSMVLSEVKAYPEIYQKLQELGFLVTRVKDYWRGEKFAGMKINYAKTLGEDRLMLSFFAFKNQSLPILIIDAGTFTTLDIVTKDGFQGGYIAPGIEIFFQTFEGGQNLQGHSLHPNTQNSLPQDTASAMGSSYQAFAALAKFICGQHNIKKILLTGGNGDIWREYLKQMLPEVVVEKQDHLIHFALQYWMSTQIEIL